MLGMAGIIVGVALGVPASWAADDTGAVEAAQVEAPEATVEHIRAAIEAETDPELKAAMEEQLRLFEGGELDLRMSDADGRVAFGAPAGATETAGGELRRGLPGGGLVGPPVDIGTGGGTTGGGTSGGDSLPPEARAELEAIFSQGTGDPSKDSHLREQAEQVLERYGIEHPTFGGGGDDEGRGDGMEHSGGSSQREAFERGGAFEQRGEGFERAMTEHMAPEAREQMERFMNERESMERGGMEHGGMERETMEREFGGRSSERSVEAPTHETEAPTRETEAPTHEYEAPTREYEATQHEYEHPESQYPQGEMSH